MTRTYWLGAIIVSYLVVAACTSLTKNECLGGNWLKIGQHDGERGRPLSLFKDHVKNCGKHGVRPNKHQYEDGRNFGLAKYCTTLSGFSAGRYSQTYHNVCPAETRGEFIRGYELGSQFGQVESQLSSVKHSIDEIRGTLRKDKIKPDERQRLDGQLDRLRDEKHRLEREIGRIRTVANRTL